MRQFIHMPRPSTPPAIQRPAHFLPGGRCVLLRHTLPDGSWHIDWLSESDNPARDGDGDADAVADDNNARTLIAFRLPQPLHELRPGDDMPAQRIDDHRRVYLKYEGPVGRESAAARGDVQRIAAGRVERVEYVQTTPPQPSSTTRLAIRWQHDAARPGGALQTIDLDSTGRVRCVQIDGAAQ